MKNEIKTIVGALLLSSAITACNNSGGNKSAEAQPPVTVTQEDYQRDHASLKSIESEMASYGIRIVVSKNYLRRERSSYRANLDYVTYRKWQGRTRGRQLTFEFFSVQLNRFIGATNAFLSKYNEAYIVRPENGLPDSTEQISRNRKILIAKRDYAMLCLANRDTFDNLNGYDER